MNLFLILNISCIILLLISTLLAIITTLINTEFDLKLILVSLIFVPFMLFISLVYVIFDDSSPVLVLNLMAALILEFISIITLFIKQIPNTIITSLLISLIVINSLVFVLIFIVLIIPKNKPENYENVELQTIQNRDDFIKEFDSEIFEQNQDKEEETTENSFKKSWASEQSKSCD